MGGTRLRPVGEGGHIIEDEGIPLAQRPALNFLGDGVVAADSPGKTNVTIPGATPIPPFDFNETAQLREDFDSGIAQGVWFKQDEAIADGTSTVMELNNPESIAITGRAKYVIIFVGRISGTPNKIGFRINGIVTATFNQVGTKVKTGDVVVGVVDDQLATQWGFIQTLDQFEPNSVVLTIYPQATNGLNGSLEENFGDGLGHARVTVGNGSESSLKNIQIITDGINNFLLGSKAYLYVLNVDDG